MKTFPAILLFIELGGLKYETKVESVAVNVALQGLAFQSSSYLGQGEAHLAIDGNTNTDYRSGSCSKTTYEYQPWWTVDLRRGYLINTVTITSQLMDQADDLTSQVPWAEIHVGESLEDYGVYNPSCSVIKSMPAGSTTSVPCFGSIGRYITVVMPNRFDTLTLCEVQVAVINVPDRQLGLMITSQSSIGSNLLQNTETLIQMLKENAKTNIRMLTRGIDNIIQRGGSCRKQK
ncbi:fucolectin-like [Dendrobates tinctorius]|uniref:fucolectin-like n=1 Tax=Dendrobates tinctorius TaxID=92724 RepID=UPI003CCA64B9